MPSARNFLIYLLSLLVIVAAGVTSSSHAPAAGPAGDVMRPLPPPFMGRERLRLVLIGADDREERGRSDTLMVLQVSPNTGRAALLSIPRDLRVTIPDTPEGDRWKSFRHVDRDKVNHAYKFGDVKLTRRTVEDLLAVPMDGFVKVNLQGFEKAVDILGGVDLEVEDQEGQGRGMNYDCPQDGLVIHLKPGRQHLTGYKAMGYVRYRKSNIPGAGGTDFDRAKRQQKFIKALLAQKVKVNNLPALAKAGRQIKRCFKTSLSMREMLDLARFMRAMEGADLKSFTLPAGDSSGGGSYLELDETEFAAMMAEIDGFLQGEGQTVAEETEPVRVEVLNGSGQAGAAAAAAEKLKAAGYEIVTVGNAPSTGYTANSVLYRGKLDDSARRVATLLGGAAVEQDPSGPAPDGTAQVRVIIGKSFQMN